MANFPKVLQPLKRLRSPVKNIFLCFNPSIYDIYSLVSMRKKWGENVKNESFEYAWISIEYSTKLRRHLKTEIFKETQFVDQLFPTKTSKRHNVLHSAPLTDQLLSLTVDACLRESSTKFMSLCHGLLTCPSQRWLHQKLNRKRCWSQKKTVLIWSGNSCFWLT